MTINLTKRKLQVARMIAGGHTNRAIAEELCLSVNTIKRHISDMMNQSGALNRAHLAVLVERRLGMWDIVEMKEGK